MQCASALSFSNLSNFIGYGERKRSNFRGEIHVLRPKAIVTYDELGQKRRDTKKVSASVRDQIFEEKFTFFDPKA